MNIVLLGPAGSGKGTISHFLSKNYGLKHISTGELLRENIKNRTALGISAENYTSKGLLVPDEIVIEMIKNIVDIQSNNLIFDGFPRSIIQAKKLDEICNIDLVLVIIAKQDLLIQRLLSRRVCPKCNFIYSTEDNVDICNNCKTKLIVRDDDNLETIKKRLSIYNKSIKKLTQYYDKKVKTVDNSKDILFTINIVKKIVDGN